MVSGGTEGGHRSGVRRASHGSSNSSRRYETPASMRAMSGAGLPEETTKKKKKPPGAFKVFWTQYGLTWKQALLLMKCGLPPTIVLAITQSLDVALIWGTVDYLAAIAAVLGLCILPRAKFIQTLIANVIATCLGAALGLIALTTAIQARINTTPPGSTALYNSSASAVLAIWLFVFIYLTHSMRSAYPKFAITTIFLSIFIIVSTSNGTVIPTTATALVFIRRLLISFLAGLAVAAGVSLFILPVTCRSVVFREMGTYIKALDGSIKAQARYFESIEQSDMLSRVENDQGGQDGKSHDAASLQKAAIAVSQIHGKLDADLPLAKREIAYGYIDGGDLTKLTGLFRAVMLPLLGLAAMVEVFDRVADTYEVDAQENLELSQKRKRDVIQDWNEIMQLTHQPFQSILRSMSEGLQHVAIQLKFERDPHASRKRVVRPGSRLAEDMEHGTHHFPGGEGFAEHIDRQCDEFYEGKDSTLTQWCHRKGVELDTDFFEDPNDPDTALGKRRAALEAKLGSAPQRQRQLFFVLYVEYLLYTTGKAMVDLVVFADELAEKSTKSHIIWPGRARVKKWVRELLHPAEEGSNDAYKNASTLEGRQDVDLGQAYKAKRDPDHLPPEGFWQHIGEYIRKIPAMLRSRHSCFGFRTACAVMSVAIVAYLAETQKFFVQERLTWAAIMVVISMAPTTGQVGVGFALRMAGSILAVVCCFFIWYAADQKTPAIIVLFWVFASALHYILLKLPQYTVAGIISIVTLVLILGYELEARVLGTTYVQSNGQKYYQVYILAPYRLATVLGGLFVAFIWTILPYPISEHSALRQDTSSALYLLANFYSIVHEINRGHIRGDAGDETVKGSPAHSLNKVRRKVYSKCSVLLTTLRTHSALLKWEIPVGGRFPAEKYTRIIDCIQKLLNYMALVTYASREFKTHSIGPGAVWMKDFRRLMIYAGPTSQEVTSMLCLLSGAIADGKPLPPYLLTPQPYSLARRLHELDKDILSAKHIGEPGYAAFAVMQICTRCIMSDLDVLLNEVKELVGVLDFSFQVKSMEEVGNGEEDDESFFDAQDSSGRLPSDREKVE